MSRDPDTRYRYIRLVGSLGTIPLLLAVGPLVGFFAGRWLDNRLGTAPWLQGIGAGLGFVAAIRSVVRLVQQVRRDIDKM